MPASSEVKVQCDNQTSNRGPPKWRSRRFFLAYMVSTGLMVVFYQRVSFSMVIVCMVNHTALAAQRHTHLPEMNASTENESIFLAVDANNDDEMLAGGEEDGKCQRKTTSSASEDGPFVWGKSLQGLLLGSLYWGYAVPQIPGGYVIQRKGARIVVGLGIIVMSTLHVLCHPAALLSPWAVFALRVGIGFCTGLAIPAMYSVWGRWSPVAERSLLIGIAFAGQMVANASVFPLSAVLCQYGFWGGWPSVFYVFGILGLLWSAAWFLLMSNTPESHSTISPAERDYILATRAAVKAQKQKLPVPWRSILTAPCFWAIAVSQFTYNWGFFLMISNLPTFMYEAMAFDINSNGLFSMLPYICLFFCFPSAGFLADWIIKKRLLSVARTRKLLTAIGYLIPAVLLVVLLHIPCDQVGLVVGLLVVAVGLTGMANTGGFFVNPYEIAPKYATSICTATNTMATAAGAINPYIVAAVTKDQTREQWQVVFYITAGVFAFGTLVFGLLGRGEVQEWARPPDEEMEIHSLEDAKLADSDDVEIECRTEKVRL